MSSPGHLCPRVVSDVAIAVGGSGWGGITPSIWDYHIQGLASARLDEQTINSKRTYHLRGLALARLDEQTINNW